MTYSRSVLLILILAATLGGCTSLKKINDYANTSRSSLQNYEHLSCSFTQAFTDRLRQQEFGNYFSVTKLELDSTRPLRGSHITLTQARAIDSAMTVIYHVIAGYFDGLARLSADSLTAYSIDTVTNTLAGGALIDTTVISPAAIGAYGAIVRDITMAVTNEYRARHLATYLAEADTPIHILLDKFGRNLRYSLYSLLESQRQIYRDEIYPDMLSKAAAGFEKKQVIDDYQRQIDGINEKERLIDTYTQGLQKIAEGHRYLATHVHQMKEKDVKAALSGYASTIKDLYSNFIIIKNH